MKDQVQEVHAVIETLMVKVQEGYGIRRQLEAAQNRLAYLTASAFVVVDSGEDVVVYGVSSEIKTHVRGGLFVSPATGQAVNVTCSLGLGNLTFFIASGSQVSFKINEGEFDSSRTYHVRAFAKSDAAEDWAQQRRLGNISR